MTWEQISIQLASADEECRLQGLRDLAQVGINDRLHVVMQSLGDESWRVRKEAVNLYLSMPTAGRLAGQVIELLHAEDNAGLRNAAVEILVRLGRQAVPFLLDELKSNDHDVRKFILDILGEIADESTFPAMVGMLADSDENVRASAAENLGKVRARDAVPALLAALTTPHLLLRFTILQSLSQIGAPVPASAILSLYEHQLLRKPLFDCLGRIGGSDCVSLLITGLNDTMRNVREAAAIALVELLERDPDGVVRELQSIRETAAASALIEMLGAPARTSKRAALRLLGAVRDPRAARRLLDFFDDDEFSTLAVHALIASGRETVCELLTAWSTASLRVKSYLAYVFAEADCKEALEVLRTSLLSDDQQLRVVAIHALGRLGSQDELVNLVSFVNDDEDDVRLATMEAMVGLGKRYPEEVVKLLQDSLNDESAAVRCAVVQVFGRIGGPVIESALLLAMKDESAMVRSAAVRYLNGLASCGHRQQLTLALTDEASEVRKQAAEGLGLCGDPATVASLGLALNDDDLWVRTAVIRALGRIGGDEAIDYICRGLRDPVGLVTITALETLNELAPAVAYPELCNVLGHPDIDVLTTALHLLSGHDCADWIPSCGNALLAHQHWDVRLTAARLIAEKGGESGYAMLEAHLLIEGEQSVSEALRELLSQYPNNCRGNG